MTSLELALPVNFIVDILILTAAAERDGMGTMRIKGKNNINNVNTSTIHHSPPFSSLPTRPPMHSLPISRRSILLVHSLHSQTQSMETRRVPTNIPWPLPHCSQTRV